MTDWDAYYRTRYQPDLRRRQVWRAVCQWLQPEVPHQATVLDIGAGYCDFVNQIHAGRKLALDVSDAVRHAAAPDVETHIGSCTNLSFAADASVDVAFVSNLFEHLPLTDVQRTLQEIRRVLRPAGKLLVIQPNFRYAYREYFDDFTHLTVFTDRSLGDVITAAGLDVLRVWPRFLPFSLKSRIPVIPALVRLYLCSPIKPFAGQMLIVARKKER